jgi:hypothetical protein
MSGLLTVSTIGAIALVGGRVALVAIAACTGRKIQIERDKITFWSRHDG